MCIRDRLYRNFNPKPANGRVIYDCTHTLIVSVCLVDEQPRKQAVRTYTEVSAGERSFCLLYTSDAADDRIHTLILSVCLVDEQPRNQAVRTYTEVSGGGRTLTLFSLQLSVATGVFPFTPPVLVFAFLLRSIRTHTCIRRLLSVRKKSARGGTVFLLRSIHTHTCIRRLSLKTVMVLLRTTKTFPRQNISVPLANKFVRWFILKKSSILSFENPLLIVRGHGCSCLHFLT